MNLSNLGWSSWIIVLNSILLIILLLQLFKKNQRDRFINYPQQVNPMASVKSDPATNTANNNYASLLLFIQQNPGKSGKLIADLKDKFFSDECAVKNNIDFQNIAQMPNGMPFSS